MGKIEHLSGKRLGEPSYTQGNKDFGREQLAKLAELDLIYQTAPIGLCLIDRELRYVHINEMLASINGKSVEEHIGRSIYEIIPEITPDIESILHKVIETGDPLLNIEVRGTTLLPHIMRRDIGLPVIILSRTKKVRCILLAL